MIVHGQSLPVSPPPATQRHGALWYCMGGNAPLGFFDHFQLLQSHWWEKCRLDFCSRAVFLHFGFLHGSRCERRGDLNKFDSQRTKKRTRRTRRNKWALSVSCQTAIVLLPCQADMGGDTFCLMISKFPLLLAVCFNVETGHCCCFHVPFLHTRNELTVF